MPAFATGCYPAGSAGTPPPERSTGEQRRQSNEERRRERWEANERRKAERARTGGPRSRPTERPTTPPPTTHQTPPSGDGALGYAGPSVVSRIALGATEAYPTYPAWNGRTLVRDMNPGFDGCDTARWGGMRGRGEYCWNHFKAMLSAHPGTDRILFMIGFKPGSELSVAQTRDIVLQVQSACSATLPEAGRCTIVLSGLPDFVDTCGKMPTSDIPRITREIAAEIASSTPDVVLGPAFSPVTPSDVTDGCHQNPAKRAAHAGELMAHLDSGP